jgi:hypothetical protein
MKRILPAVLLLALAAVAGAQDAAAPVDLLYPELAHPREDASIAIKKRDFRFITVDRFGKDAPAVNHYPRLKRRYGTRFIKQPLRIITTPSDDFSFRIRARAYAQVYNQFLLGYLLKEKS